MPVIWSASNTAKAFRRRSAKEKGTDLNLGDPTRSSQFGGFTKPAECNQKQRNVVGQVLGSAPPFHLPRLSKVQTSVFPSANLPATRRLFFLKLRLELRR
jgi:hypothetical protein